MNIFFDMFESLNIVMSDCSKASSFYYFIIYFWTKFICI